MPCAPSPVGMNSVTSHCLGIDGLDAVQPLVGRRRRLTVRPKANVTRQASHLDVPARVIPSVSMKASWPLYSALTAR